MRKSLISLIAGLVISSPAVFSEDYSRYYVDLPVEIEQVRDVVIPELRVSVLDFGAVPGSDALCTDAFKKAVKYLVANGGGHLDVPAGAYVLGPIELKSNIDLHLEKGSILNFSTDKTLYLKEGSKRALACIRASKAENVCITGDGIINGQGEYWRPVKKSKASAEEWNWCLSLGGTLIDDGNLWLPYDLNNGIPNIGTDAKDQEAYRNHLIQITDCVNVKVQGVGLLNSPKFHLVPSRCRNVIIDGIQIECPWNAQNGDGMDPGNVQTCLIVGCVVSCGDDAICMKGGAGEAGEKYGPNSDFLIQDNVVYRGHGGFVIGSEFSGGMHRLIVRNCHFEGTDTGLRFKSAPGRGGTCSDIYCYNISMKDIRNEAVIYQTNYEDKGAVYTSTDKDNKNLYYPDFCNMNIYNVVVVGAKTGIKMDGLDRYPIRDIRFSNVKMLNLQYGLRLHNARNINFDNVLIRSAKGDKIDEDTVRIYGYKKL